MSQVPRVMQFGSEKLFWRALNLTFITAVSAVDCAPVVIDGEPHGSPYANPSTSSDGAQNDALYLCDRRCRFLAG
jgi:hypothetical protein